MMPLGTRCSAVFTPLITSVCPALWPPWKRTTPCAISVSQSTSLPLPSSPHWVPTTTTLRPFVFVITNSFPEKSLSVQRPDDPLAAGQRQFAVAEEFIHFALVARQHADHGFALAAQCRDGAARLRRVPRAVEPGRTDRGLERPLGGHRHQFLHVEAEAH